MNYSEIDPSIAGDLSKLPNLTWHSLSGAHRKFTIGTETARRYATGFSPILAFANCIEPDFDAIADYCDPENQFYCGGWRGKTPQGWQVHFDSTMFNMVWQGGTPSSPTDLKQSDNGFEILPLEHQHIAQATELAAVTHPGPFGPRTIELGTYYGCFIGGRLVAMAGERLFTGNLREISGVCTHPDFQGKGLARRLMMKLIGEELQRNETPVLHVRIENAVARGLYYRIGFRDSYETSIRVISRN